MKNFIKQTGVLSIALTIAFVIWFGVNVVLGAVWTGNSAVPPSSNTEAPINVGGGISGGVSYGGQTKGGALVVGNGLGSNGLFRAYSDAIFDSGVTIGGVRRTTWPAETSSVSSPTTFTNTYSTCGTSTFTVSYSEIPSHVLLRVGRCETGIASGGCSDHSGFGFAVPSPFMSIAAINPADSSGIGAEVTSFGANSMTITRQCDCDVSCTNFKVQGILVY